MGGAERPGDGARSPGAVRVRRCLAQRAGGAPRFAREPRKGGRCPGHGRGLAGVALAFGARPPAAQRRRRRRYGQGAWCNGRAAIGPAQSVEPPHARRTRLRLGRELRGDAGRQAAQRMGSPETPARRSRRTGLGLVGQFVGDRGLPRSRSGKLERRARNHAGRGADSGRSRPRMSADFASDWRLWIAPLSLDGRPIASGAALRSGSRLLLEHRVQLGLLPVLARSAPHAFSAARSGNRRRPRARGRPRGPEIIR